MRRIPKPETITIWTVAAVVVVGLGILIPMTHGTVRHVELVALLVVLCVAVCALIWLLRVPHIVAALGEWTWRHTYRRFRPVSVAEEQVGDSIPEGDDGDIAEALRVADPRSNLGEAIDVVQGRTPGRSRAEITAEYAWRSRVNAIQPLIEPSTGEASTLRKQKLEAVSTEDRQEAFRKMLTAQLKRGQDMGVYDNPRRLVEWPQWQNDTFDLLQHALVDLQQAVLFRDNWGDYSQYPKEVEIAQKLPKQVTFLEDLLKRASYDVKDDWKN